MRRLLAAVVALAASTAFAADPVYDIPPTAAGTFDVNVLPSPDGKFKHPDQFDARFSLAWDKSDLILTVKVVDASPCETDSTEALYRADSVEIFLAAKRGDASVYQIQAASGADKKFATARKYFNDRRSKDLKEKVPLEAAVTSDITAKGYTLTVKMPWKNLAIDPKAGTELAFQLYVNDVETGGMHRHQSVFYPEPGAHVDTMKMHTIRLAEKPTPPIRLAAKASIERMARLRVDIVGEAGLSVENALASNLPGEAFRITGRSGEVLLDGVNAAPFTIDAGRPHATLRAALDDKPLKPLTIIAGGSTLELTTMPNVPLIRAQALRDLDIIARPCVFSGATFPEPDFSNPQLADMLLGPYTLKTRYFDADANEVTKADKPGRYGAVVTAEGPKGTTRRFLTLYRTPEPLPWWDWQLHMQFTPPPQIGISPQAIAAQRENTGRSLEEIFGHGMWNTDAPARLFAGLHETTGTDAGYFDSPAIKARDYWVKLRRKLDPVPAAWQQPLDLPREEKSAPALRPGSPKDAGLKDDVVSRLDALCTKWADDSKLGFNTTVARNGVIVLQKAYGNAGGKPVTNDSAFGLASITKTFSALAMMTAIDQNRLKLDDLVYDHWKNWGSGEARQTIRMLYTHTAGLEDHWGEEHHDFLDRIAPLAPYTHAAQKHEYNGTSIVLGSRLFEQISGESIPTFYRRHLLEPLGMKHTTGEWTTYGISSSSADLAILAQMLLQEGAYGGKRYLAPETVRAMHPLDLKAHPKINLPRDAEWGIGLQWRDPETRMFIGHGSAANCTFFFAPKEKLVITMAREQAGKDWGKYHDEFIKIIKESLLP